MISARSEPPARKRGPLEKFWDSAITAVFASVALMTVAGAAGFVGFMVGLNAGGEAGLAAAAFNISEAHGSQGRPSPVVAAREMLPELERHNCVIHGGSFPVAKLRLRCGPDSATITLVYVGKSDLMPTGWAITDVVETPIN